MLKIKDESGEIVGVLNDEDSAPIMAARIKVKKEEESSGSKEDKEEPKVEKG